MAIITYILYMCAYIYIYIYIYRHTHIYIYMNETHDMYLYWGVKNMVTAISNGAVTAWIFEFHI
jgi:hypothetical protein